MSVEVVPTAPAAGAARQGELLSHAAMITAFTCAGAAEAFTSTAVSVALPNMAGSLGASPDEISWAVTLYMAAFTVTLPLTAWLSDFLGQRLYLAASMALYMLASVGCAGSHSLAMLLAMRALQGSAGAAFLVRATVSFTTQMSPRAGARAMDLYLCSFIFKAIGLPVGGYLADNLSWRWLFLLPLPVIGLGGLAALAVSADVWPRRRHAMPDFFGLALLAAGLGGLYVVLYRGQREGWFDSRTIRALLPAVVVGIPLFLWHQHRTGSLLTWQSLRHRGVAAGIFFSFFVGVIVYGGLYLLPQFLRAVGRHDALGTGELTFIDAVATLTGIFVCSVGVNFARTRTWLFLSGTLFTTSMVLFATRQTSATPDEALYLPLALRGLSVGFLLVPAAMFTFRSVSSANHGHAAEARGLYYMTRQLGGAIGVAVIAAMVDYRGSVHSGQLGEHLAAVNPAVGRAVSTLAGGTVGHGMAPALAGRAAHVLLDRMVVREATVLAFQDVFFLLAAVGVAVCLLTPLFPRMRDGRKKRAAPADAGSDDRRNAAWAASMAAAAS